MMPDVADYRVIRDTAFTIQTGGDIDASFNFNLGTAVRHNQPSILYFFFVSSQNASNLSFRFSINQQPVRTINVNGNVFGTVHEVVGGGVTKDNNNEITVAIVGGSGSVSISDVVLLMQHGV